MLGAIIGRAASLGAKRVISSGITRGTKYAGRNAWKARRRIPLPRAVPDSAAQYVRMPRQGNQKSLMQQGIGAIATGGAMAGGWIAADRMIAKVFPPGKTPADNFLPAEKPHDTYIPEIEPGYAQNQFTSWPDYAKVGLGGVAGYGAGKLFDDLSTPIFGENGGPNLLTLGVIAAGGYILYSHFGKKKAKK